LGRGERPSHRYHAQILSEKKMSRTLANRWVWLLAFVVAVAGCGRSGPVPVRGKVMLDGKPLAGASVQFIPQQPGGRDATGSTDANGVFRLSTLHRNDGAFPGKYKVVVQPPAPMVLGAPAATPDDAQRAAAGSKTQTPAVIVPPKYSQPDQTVLVQEVPTGGDVLLDLKTK
jgi:hypothetical protein